MTEKKSKTNDPDIEANKGLAILSYVWILCLIPLLLKRDSKYAQFHAKQGLILFIASFAVWFPFFGQILGLIITIISIIAILKALEGGWWEIPYIYDLSKKINL